MTHTEWILVANASRARIFSREPDEPLQLVHVLEHIASRSRSAQLGSDKAGHEVGASGTGGAAFAPRLDAHRKEHQRFAHEIAEFIDHEARSGRFAMLAVFAPNPFLGEVKLALGAASVHRLVAARELDLTRASVVELDSRIATALAH